MALYADSVPISVNLNNLGDAQQWKPRTGHCTRSADAEHAGAYCDAQEFLRCEAQGREGLW